MIWLLIGICWCAAIVSEEQVIKKQITIVRDVTNKQSSDDAVTTVEKLNRLDNKQFIIEFLKLDIRAKIYYLIDLNIDQYEQFLKRFKNEDEWAVLWHKLAQDERKHIPSTLESQIKMLRNCYYKLSPKPFFARWSAPKANPPTDLAHWKIVYYANSYQPVYYEGDNDKSLYLNDLFLRKKLKMFNPG